MRYEDSEPRLSKEDLKVWDIWRSTALVHAETRLHQRRVSKAKGLIEAALQLDLATNDGRKRVESGEWAVMWSGGKDSTAMTHLALSVDTSLEVISEKDDLDFPGEKVYVQELASKWGARLTILEPQVSPKDWLIRHGKTIHGAEDLHSRSAGLSQACFYNVLENYVGVRPIMLGLRSSESNPRRKARAVNGLIYQKKSGQWVSTPLGDWTGVDVYAYLFSNDIPLLDLYRCVSFMHTEEPWRIRKSWWVPGSSGAKGQVAWLHRYYPSLYRKLTQWVPDTRHSV